MGLRAYLLLDVADDVDQEGLVTALKELEETPDVDFVDPVVGKCEMVVMVDAPITVEATASKIRSKKWVKSCEILRIVSLYERHRATKTEMLQALPHTGVRMEG
jgi:hypothetical protein